MKVNVSICLAEIARCHPLHGVSLRGRILGAARDQAWSEFRYRVGELLALCERAPLDRNRDRTALREGLSAVCSLQRRLEGLGVVGPAVVTAGVPGEGTLGNGMLAREPDALTRRLRSVLAVVGDPGPAPTGDADGNRDHQPIAAPSFLDSLAPR